MQIVYKQNFVSGLLDYPLISWSDSWTSVNNISMSGELYLKKEATFFISCLITFEQMRVCNWHHINLQRGQTFVYACVQCSRPINSVLLYRTHFKTTCYVYNLTINKQSIYYYLMIIFLRLSTYKDIYTKLYFSKTYLP